MHTNREQTREEALAVEEPQQSAQKVLLIPKIVTCMWSVSIVVRQDTFILLAMGQKYVSSVRVLSMLLTSILSGRNQHIQRD